MRVLRWTDGDNRFNVDTLARWHAALDELVALEGPLALVLTGDGKYFSNGLDLEALGAAPEQTPAVVESLHRLFGRLLVFPAYTVAALNGHAFAAGAMLACATDWRIMREDRGYWCLPEVDLGIALTDPMYALVSARLPRPTTSEALLTGRRFPGPEALTKGLVDELAPEPQVLERAVQHAAQYAGKNRHVITTHKRQMFGAAARACGFEP